MSAKYSVVIIDDEPLARSIIRTHLQRFDDFSIVEECSDGFAGVKAVNTNSPDLLFLDVQMPKLGGFEMLELLTDPPLIIFCTAYDNYALQAFEVSAADYLLKPFSAERFDEAMGKVRHLLAENSRSRSRITQLIEYNDSQVQQLERIPLRRRGGGVVLLPVDELIYIEAQGDYVKLHATSGSHLKQKSMRFFESRLSSSTFVRLHRSYLVNITHIEEIFPSTKDSYTAALKTGVELPVSKGGYQKFRELIG